MTQSNTGLIYLFTGNGKGKTSAALGVAMRAISANLTAAMIQWYKNPAWRISEHQFPKLLTIKARKRFAIYPLGIGFHLTKPVNPLTKIKQAPLKTGQTVIDNQTDDRHQQAAQTALNTAHQLINQVNVLILDEINNAVHDNLVSLDQLKQLIQSRHATHLILTGRNAHPDIIALADLVSQINNLKHPYDQGKTAVKGLDY